MTPPRAQSYFKEALSEPLHALTLPAALLLAALAVFLKRGELFVAAAAIEGGFLLIYPRLPGFRRKCELGWARDDAEAIRDQQQAAASRLSENARARLRSLEQHRDNLLNQLRTWNDATSLEAAWRPRLDELIGTGLRLLLALDSFPPNPRAESFDDSQLAQLQKEIDAGHPGPARDAKLQRLKLLQARVGRGPNLGEQREAAAVQFDTLEDLLEDLERAALEGRDAAAFGARLEQVAALIEATRQSVNALEAQAPAMAEVAEAKRLS